MRNEELGQQVARRLRQLREEKGLSIRALAQQSKLGPEVVSRAERGIYVTELGTLSRLCDGLGLTLSAFFDEDGAHQPTDTFEAERLQRLLATLPVAVKRSAIGMLETFSESYRVRGSPANQPAPSPAARPPSRRKRPSSR